ncbi:Uncharacterised protein at_DN0057 [Pycnogonum litorale]
MKIYTDDTKLIVNMRSNMYFRLTISEKKYLKCVVIFYFLIFCILLPFLCHDMVHSVYFYNYNMADTHTAQAEDLNALRLQTAQRYFDNRSPVQIKSFYEKQLSCEQLEVLILVLTKNRDFLPGKSSNLGYLTQVMAAFDANIRGYYSDHVNSDCITSVVLCNVNKPGLDHAESVYMSKFFPATKFLPSDDYISLNGQRDIERQDKIMCFKESLIYNYKYLLMIEDDALPVDSFLTKVIRVLRNKVEYPTVRGERINRTTEWAFLKFHYPEKWLGYSIDIMSILELISVGLIGGTIFILAEVIINKKLKFLKLPFLCGMIFSILFVFVVGRQYFLNFYSLDPGLYLLQRAPGCCTPATLYPRKQVINLISYLKNVICHSKYGFDLAIDDYASKNKLTAFLVLPNIFRHIGMYSSLTVQKNPQYYLT